MNFSAAQLKQLETKTRTLPTTYIVAQTGVRENIVWGLNHTWGLVKIGFPTTNRSQLLAMAKELASRTNSEILFVYGSYAVYYRQHPSESIASLLED
jgi:RNA-binding protein YhbY